MGLSFNYPFELGDSNGAIKSDIAQLKQDVGDLSQLETADKSSLVNALNEAIDSTLNGASRDLSNLSDLGNDKLRSLNSYANYGELLADADGLSFVQKYAHSTFDLSKFTVVGSPTITSDGIASGFSNSNYIQTPLNLTYTNTCKVIFPFTTSSDISGTQRIYYFGSSTDAISFGIGGIYRMAIPWTDVNGNSAISTQNNYYVTANTSYLVKLEDDGTTQSMSIKKVTDTSWTILGSRATSTKLKLTNTLTMGRSLGVTDNELKGSIDLKQFSITVDGVPVFSGNKTGIDTIKPDDYTVVGTPTISDDMIITSAPTGNYVKTSSINLASANTWDIELAVKPKVSTLSSSCALAVNADTRLVFSLSTNLTLSAFYNVGSVNTSFSSSTGLTVNVWNKIRLAYNGTAVEMFLLFDNSWVKIGSNTSLNTTLNNFLAIGAGQSSLQITNSEVEIDLNAFKIYINGNLVYQPCLKIPYTWSNTGSKIVDSIYRDRVNDMAEQFGYANYYTLSDTDFTLPQVELYGLIGQRTLRDSYRNGINYWELYSNRDLEQGGSCTSGVEVTFAKPFADTNYVLSVPYSAKSATAFTPTQTGDWIAKGKGLL